MSLTITSGAHCQEVTDTWDHKISVTTGVEDFEGEALYAYTTSVYESSESAVHQILINRINVPAEGKLTGKNVIRAVEVNLQGLNIDAVDFLAKTVSADEPNIVMVSLAFINGEGVTNPREFPTEDKIAREVIFKLGVLLNQSVVTAQIADAKTLQSTLENKHLALVSRLESLERTFATVNAKLSNLEADNSEIKTNLAQAQSEVASLKMNPNSQTHSTDDLDKYDAAQKNMVDAEAQLLINEQSIVNTNEKANLAQKELQEMRLEVSELSEQLKKQKKFIARLNAKHAAIG